MLEDPERERRLKEIADLEREIHHHNQRYWIEDSPEISDSAYDRLVRRLIRMAPDSPLLQEIGAPKLESQLALSDSGDIPGPIIHRPRMLSLDKCYDDEALIAWSKRISGAIIATPKMDGIACSLRYDRDGKYIGAATRGDGTSGEDVSDNARAIKGIPVQIQNKNKEILEIRGEVYMRLSVFSRFDKDFANPRNLAAGALKSKKSNRCRVYELSFAAYDLLGSGAPLESIKLDQLRGLGFDAVDAYCPQADRLPDAYAYFSEQRAALDAEIDGVVFKADRVSEHERLGSTAHHPRFAIAYKFQGDSKITVLEDVEWHVSRSGIITPVARVQSVPLSGAIISRASLHHAGYIQKLGLYRGAHILVTRRGGVIPKVERVIPTQQEPMNIGQPVFHPTQCPSCGQGVRRTGDFLRCVNPSECRDSLLGMLSHYCRVVGLKGFGGKFLADAYRQGFVRQPADLYRLKKEDLLQVSRVGPRLADRLLAQVKERSRLELAVFLRSLGIAEMGERVSGVLAQIGGTLDAVLEIDKAVFATHDGIGDQIALSVVEGLAAHRSQIAVLREVVDVIPVEKGERAGLSAAATSDSANRGTGGVLSGRTVLFTGKLETMDRKRAHALVRELGGSVLARVTANLDLLIAGGGRQGVVSKKQQEAERLIRKGNPIEIISEDVFLSLVSDTPAYRKK